MASRGLALGLGCRLISSPMAARALVRMEAPTLSPEGQTLSVCTCR